MSRVDVSYVNDHDGSTDLFPFDSREEAAAFVSKIEDMKESFSKLGPMVNDYGMICTEAEGKNAFGWLKVWEAMVLEYGAVFIPDDINDRKRMVDIWMASWNDLIMPIIRRGDRSGRDTRFVDPQNPTRRRR